MSPRALMRCFAEFMLQKRSIFTKNFSKSTLLSCFVQIDISSIWSGLFFAILILFKNAGEKTSRLASDLSPEFRCGWRIWWNVAKSMKTFNTCTVVKYSVLWWVAKWFARPVRTTPVSSCVHGAMRSRWRFWHIFKVREKGLLRYFGPSFKIRVGFKVRCDVVRWLFCIDFDDARLKEGFVTTLVDFQGSWWG